MYASFNIADRKGNSNTGSCQKLGNYLDKEIKNQWFNDHENEVKTQEVISEIDRYGKGQLGKNDWKFVEIEYSPSQKEQLQIVKKATGREDVHDWQQLNNEEKQKTIDEFKIYVCKAQSEQAKNYNRENLNDSSDLKWYGKIETERRYKGYDEEVKSQEKKSGELKEGLQIHCHIIQSRKAYDKETKISPLSKNRSQSDKNKIQQGFDRNKFYSRVDELFDKEFNYERELNEVFEYQKACKYNRLEEKLRLEEEYKPQKSKVMTLQELHNEMSKNADIEKMDDYKQAMEQNQVRIIEIQNEKNQIIDLKLKSENEEKNFTDLQENLAKEIHQEEIRSEWIREQQTRQEQLKEERTRQEQERERGADMEKRKNGFGY